MNRPDVVGSRTDPFGWTMIGLAALAPLVMIGATIGLFVAWIGAVLNTANLADKTWFVSPGRRAPQRRLPRHLAYVTSGPDGQPTAVPPAWTQPVGSASADNSECGDCSSLPTADSRSRGREQSDTNT
jgi:hypothetical protein